MLFLFVVLKAVVLSAATSGEGNHYYGGYNVEDSYTDDEDVTTKLDSPRIRRYEQDSNAFNPDDDDQVKVALDQIFAGRRLDEPLSAKDFTSFLEAEYNTSLTSITRINEALTLVNNWHRTTYLYQPGTKFSTQILEEIYRNATEMYQLFTQHPINEVYINEVDNADFPTRAYLLDQLTPSREDSKDHLKMPTRTTKQIKIVTIPSRSTNDISKVMVPIRMTYADELLPSRQYPKHLKMPLRSTEDTTQAGLTTGYGYTDGYTDENYDLLTYARAVARVAAASGPATRSGFIQPLQNPGDLPNSYGDKELKVDGDKELKVDGDKELKLDGDKELKLDGDKELKLDGDKELKLDGDKELTPGGDNELTPGGDNEPTLDGDNELTSDDKPESTSASSKKEPEGATPAPAKSTAHQCPTKKTTTKKKTTKKRTTVQFDVEKFLEIVANLTYDYYSNLTQKVNETLQRMSMKPTCPTLSPPATEFDYTLYNDSMRGKCFVCGMTDTGIPRHADCADAFAGDFIPLVPQNPKAKGQIAMYRKYCVFKADVKNYMINHTMPRLVWGRWTGGCSVRWTDLSGVYTQRMCRSKYKAAVGQHYASKRMAKLEMALSHTDNGCIISPVATLLPLSRGISLFARFHACVCTGSWCNGTMPVTHVAVSLLVVAMVMVTLRNLYIT